jgi:glycerol-3-phosphate acyltransferase PlsY
LSGFISSVPVPIRVVVALVAAYLIGGTPFSLIVGKLFYHTDLRRRGSGNLGATNVFRVLGTPAAVGVAVLDVSKGSAAVLVAALLVPATGSGLLHEWVLIGATVSAMFGHSFSPYIRFTGGKGVAVAAGALLVLTPRAWPLVVLTFVLVSALTRYASMGSMIAAAAFPFYVLWLYAGDVPTIIFAFVAAAIVIWRHRSNIGRLRRGEESKIDVKNAAQRTRDAAARARRVAALARARARKRRGGS